VTRSVDSTPVEDRAGRRSLGSELLRKVVHVGMGGFALLLRWLAPWQAALCALAAVAFNLFALHRLTRRRLLRAGEAQSGFSWGIALYPAVVLAVIVVFQRRMELAAAVWGLLAFGDGMATVTGVLVGGRRLPWNREKSWAGFIAFVLYGTAAAAFLIRWTQQAVLDSALRGAAGESQLHVGTSFLAVRAADSIVSDPVYLLLGCLVAALAAAFAESLDSGIDDNFLVPLVGGSVLFAATLVEPSRLVDAAGTLGTNLLSGAAINAVLALVALAARGVGRSGALWGWALGTTLFAFGGWRGFLMLFSFFVLGTAATRLGHSRKAALGIAQERGGRRGAGNAFANTGAGVLFAVMSVATPHPELFTIALVAAFATAACDTVSSEIGQAYGKRHFLVTSLRRVRAGTEGAVSLEGTLAGIIAAAVLGVAAWSIGLIDTMGAIIVTVAAFVGTTVESYIGAVAERFGGIDNEAINFANTVLGALTAGALFVILR